jgi:3',5'-cyclic AMP phosphodiesterase CpdA
MRWGPGLVTIVLLAAGCGGSATAPHEKITFANLAGIYFSTTPGTQVDGALVEDSESLLVRAVADLNKVKDLSFVVVSGNLFARPDALSLDRAKGVLAELKVPYYVVFGDHDVPADKQDLSRTVLELAFQGHGIEDSRGYWAHEAAPGLLLIGLDTAQAGRRAGHVDATQLEWLDKMLTQHADKTVVVVAHHGLVPIHPLDEGSQWRDLLVDNAAAVGDVIRRHKNVELVVTGHHHAAAGSVTGSSIYLAGPSLAVWPLAYQLVRLTPREVEAIWVPVGTDDQTRRAQERLLSSKALRGVFPAGDDGDTACVRFFGSHKMEVYSLQDIRP